MRKEKRHTENKQSAAAKAPVAKSPVGHAAAKPKRNKAANTRSAKEKPSSTLVNIGHIFSLRPRVSTAFKPGDFSAAKQLLRDETFESIEAAARAVAEKALDLTNEGGSPWSAGRGRH